ncbi:hypothetical protein CU098_011179, partial [Rhizopus stolonifer]
MYNYDGYFTFCSTGQLEENRIARTFSREANSEKLSALLHIKDISKIFTDMIILYVFGT